mmetsp:Transcript_126150/g.315321  ORF Transcript_126150/g.315321 Transcript_126150/m.315321 type:complete len:581 (-) Transcript_126150:341-2083(-)
MANSHKDAAEEEEVELLSALRLEANRFQRSVQEAMEVALQDHLRQQERLLAGGLPRLLGGSPSAKAALTHRKTSRSLVEDASMLELRLSVKHHVSSTDVDETAGSTTTPTAMREASAAEIKCVTRRTSKERIHEVQAAHGSKLHAFLLTHCRSWLVWWWGLEEPKRTSVLARFLASQIFSNLVATVICANSIVSAAIVNHDIHRQNTPITLQVFDACFVTFFTVEVVLKLWVHGLYFFIGSEAGWNTFDFALASLSMLQLSLDVASQAHEAYKTNFLRLIRLLRLTRALRGLQVFRAFSELRVILRCVISSFSSMFWSFIMLAFTIFLFSLLILQTLQTDFQAHHDSRNSMSMVDANDVQQAVEASIGQSAVDTDTQALMDNFGSVQQTMLSLYISSMGGQDWKFYLDMIPQDSTKVIFVLYIFFFHVTVLNILTGLYVDSALRFAAPGRQARAKDVLVRRIADHEELHQFCCQHGIIGDASSISRAAFRTAFSNEHFAAYLATFGINSSNPDELYSCLLDLGTPLTGDSLVSGLLKLREPATSYDIERAAQRTRTILNDAGIGRSSDIKASMHASSVQL